MKRILAAAALAALLAVTVAGVTAPAAATQAPDSEVRVITAQGNPNLVDFLALSAKRSNLRVDIAKNGLDAAFTQWLRNERPQVYALYAR